MDSRVAVIVAAGALLCAPGVVYGQEEVEESDFNALFAQGFEAYQAKAYDQAIAAWKQASGIEDQAILSFNIAKAHDKAGRPKAALEALRYALASKVEPLEGAALEKAKAFEVELVAKLNAIEASRYRDKRFGWMSWTGAGVLLVGGALTVVGPSVYGGRARDGLEVLNPKGAERDYDEQRESIARNQSTGKWLVGVGAGLSAVGVGLLLFDALTVERVLKEQEAKPHTTLQWSVSPWGIDALVRF